MVARETEHELDLKSGVSIVVGTANYRAVRGRTVVCAVLDEVGVWKSETTMAPDVETYSALTPALARIPGSMLIGISTPFRRRGLLLSAVARNTTARTTRMCWWWPARRLYLTLRCHNL